MTTAAYSLSGRLTILERKVAQHDERLDDGETNLYIVIGVLAAVQVVLIAAVVVLLFLIIKIKQQFHDSEDKARIEKEMEAQKMASYTGEEMHRKLMGVSQPAVPLPAPIIPAPEEYAFNVPYVDKRLLAPKRPPRMNHL